MADLGLTTGAICDQIESYTGNTDVGNALAHVNAGYRRFLAGQDPRSDKPATHAWSFLRPLAALEIGGTVALTASGVESTGVITASVGNFDESMVGLYLTITSLSETVQITDVTSTTTAVADFDADFADLACTVESTGIYDLPSDFGGLASPLVYQHSVGDYRLALEEASAEKVFDIWREDPDVGDTVYWAIVSAAFVTATGQRWKLILAPAPDEAMQVQYRYRALADVLSDDANYPLGGPLHVETIKAAAIADAEFVTSRTVGFAENRFKELMTMSIDLDDQLFDTDGFESTHDVDVGYD